MSEFSEFGRLPKPTLIPSELNEVVARTVALAAKPFPKAAVTVSCAAGLPRVSFDAELLSRVIGNLAKNGLEAMGGVGALTVETIQNGTQVTVRVRDTGPGLSDEARERLFSPLFTTKSGGTGLGLVISQRIAAEHGGTLTLQNLTEGGCMAELTLPLAATEA